MTKYSGVIFDLDGTLVYTIEDIGDSMNEVLKIYNLDTFSYEEYKQKIGRGLRRLVINSFPEDTIESTIDEALETLYKVYAKKYLNKSKPYDGIRDLLCILNKKGLKLAVNSNKKDEYTKNIINKFFDNIPFTNIYGEREGIPNKPDPTSTLEIAKNMNLEPNEILFIGDSEVDILTATNANMDSVGVLWGFRDYDVLKKSGAKYMVSDWKEILDIIE